jgi:tetratricopeptide (TPR) repeat protein
MSIQIDTLNQRYYACLAFILHGLNQFGEALHWTNALKHLNPQNEAIQGQLGNLYMVLGKDLESADCFRSVLRINPKSE